MLSSILRHTKPDKKPFLFRFSTNLKEATWKACVTNNWCPMLNPKKAMLSVC